MFASLASGKSFTVSKSGTANFNSIQAAVNVAAAGDSITIFDNSIYEEQVTIDSTKDELTIRYTDPQSIRRPVIRWLDNQNIGPRNCYESSNPENYTYNKNGALRILNAEGVSIEGLIIDGGYSLCLGYSAVLNMKDPLLVGNSAINHLMRNIIVFSQFRRLE